MDLGSFGRIPPQNIEAEQSVLGAILLDKEVLSSVTEIISSQDFYREDIYITNAIKYRLSKVKPETNRVSNRPATKMRFLKTGAIY